MSTHQRKRINEMLTNLLKDLGEIGVAIGGDGDMKVYSFLDMSCSLCSAEYRGKNVSIKNSCLVTWWVEV